jgi:hypothetical protein
VVDLDLQVADHILHLSSMTTTAAVLHHVVLGIVLVGMADIVTDIVTGVPVGSTMTTVGDTDLLRGVVPWMTILHREVDMTTLTVETILQIHMPMGDPMTDLLHRGTFLLVKGVTPEMADILEMVMTDVIGNIIPPPRSDVISTNV